MGRLGHARAVLLLLLCLAPFLAISTQTQGANVTLPEALDTEATDLEWRTGAGVRGQQGVVGGAGAWFGQTAVSSPTGGGDAAQSGPIGPDEFSWMDVQAAGPGTVTFNWKISSEASRDTLTFLVNGEVRDTISGETAWATKTYPLGDGWHTLQWIYAKDVSGNAGSDAAWVDRVRVEPTQWTQVATTGPSAQGSHAMVYDSPQTFYVSWNTGDDITGDGSASRPWKHLAMALYSAPAGTEDNPSIIKAAEGVYPELLSITKDWTWIEGSYDTETWDQIPGEPVTSIDGEFNSRVVYVTPGLTGIQLSRVTLTNGVSDSGGGVKSESSLTMRNSVVRNCRATQRGGGIWMGASATLTLVDSIVEENIIIGSASDYRGGGIYGTCVLLRSVVRNNRIELENDGRVKLGQVFGGGIFGDCTLGESTVSGNSISAKLTYYNGSDDVFDGEQALAYGGGIYGTCLLTDSTVRGNRAYAHGANRYFDYAIAKGGGIFGTSTLTRCMVSDNVVHGNHGGSRWDYYEAGAYGGGIFGTSTIADSDIRGNVATATAITTAIQRNASGGGVYSTNCNLTSTTLTGNSAGGSSTGWGGAVAGNGILTACRVENNHADLQGGGLYRPASGGALRAVDTLLAGNSSARGGGAYGNMTLDRCVVRGNKAGLGHGAGLHGDAPDVTNSLFIKNEGIGASIAAGVIRHSLFALNTPIEGHESEGLRLHGNGARLFNNLFVHNDHGVFEASASANPAELKNNLFFGNAQCPYMDDGSFCQSLFFQINGMQGAADNIIGQDPLFIDPARGDFHMTSGSPAIDAALDSEAAPFDFHGNQRPFGASADIGPFETGHALPPLSPTLVSPPDLQTEVPHLTHFQWQDAPRAEAYDLYVWRAERPRPPLPLVTGLTKPDWFNEEALDNFASYRWQVIAKNDAGRAESDVWTFQTLRAEALLRLAIEGNGRVRVNGALRDDGWEEWFPFGSVVWLEAIEGEDSSFVQWSGDIAPANAQATMINITFANPDRAVTARYRLTPPKVELSPSSLQYVLWPEETTTQVLRITNKGDRIRRNLTFEVTSGTNSVSGESTLGMEGRQSFSGFSMRGNIYKVEKNTILKKIEPYVSTGSYITGDMSVFVYETTDPDLDLVKIYEASTSTYGPAGSDFFPFGYYKLPSLNVPLIAGRYYLIGSYINTQHGTESWLAPQPTHFGVMLGGHQSAGAIPGPDTVKYSPIARTYTMRLTTSDSFKGVDWLTVTPSTGTIPWGDSIDLCVAVGGVELPGDLVGSQLNFTTNDEDVLTTCVTISRRIPRSVMSLDPESIQANLRSDQATSQTLRVTNLGGANKERLRFRVTAATDSSGGVDTVGNHSRSTSVNASLRGNVFLATRNTRLTKFEPYIGIGSYLSGEMSFSVYESSELHGIYTRIFDYTRSTYGPSNTGFYPFKYFDFPHINIPIVSGRYYLLTVGGLVSCYHDSSPDDSPVTAFGVFQNGFMRNGYPGPEELINLRSDEMVTMRLTTTDPLPGQDWLSVEPAGGEIQAAGFMDLNVFVNSTGMPPGEFQSVLNFTSSDPNRETTSIPVYLSVAASTPTPTPTPTPSPSNTATPTPVLPSSNWLVF
jgi:hypothetical protein